MQIFQDSFETCKQSLISAFSGCMTVPSIVVQISFCVKKVASNVLLADRPQEQKDVQTDAEGNVEGLRLFYVSCTTFSTQRVTESCYTCCLLLKVRLVQTFM